MDDPRLTRAATKPGRPKGPCAGGTIEIDAPIDVVWNIAGDWQGWGAWNPLYIRTEGDPREGATIDMTVAVEGMKPMDAKATVFTYRPDELFTYGLSNMGGLMRAFRFVELTEIAPGRTLLANGEIMSGPIGYLIGKLAGPKVGKGLRAMNAKIKEMAEAKARERQASSEA